MADRPQDGPGRPSPRTPRAGNARRSGLQPGLTARADRRATPREAAGCCGLRTPGPTAGAFAPRAGDVLPADPAPPGVAPPWGGRKDPVRVNRRFRQQPERLDAVGLVCCRAWRRWRRVARARRRHVETPGSTWPGGAPPETPRPPAVMRLTKVAGVLGRNGGRPRPLARPRSAVHQPYLPARGRSVRCVTWPAGEQSPALAGPPRSRRHRALRRWLAAAHARPGRVTSSRHQGWGRVFPGDLGPLSARLRTWDAAGLLVSGRSPAAQPKTAGSRRKAPKGASTSASRGESCESPLDPSG